ncbi:stage II sporulation protein M [Bogoriella caseilytica]|uniref:Putative membrane protein SpoIIM required for sporulation n=1 Tax=Bogoriella caseilytica TaxID=56055 RepID=A0A3N2BA08_9MICO|nr:stage II sporulation protein M [Bogoriella caseilytica]ROR72091.1 putative membrane protein SpoIIM required for sporulation [Bogoriella caseilytica]
MDPDAYAAVHEAQWRRLEQLVRRRDLSGEEADELIRLYQATAGHLTQLRSKAPDPQLVSRLSVLLGQARGKVGGAHELRLADLWRYFAVTVPAGFYRVRWWTVGVMIGFLAVAVVTGWWLATNPGAMAQIGPPSQLESYAEEAFAAYYTNYPPPDFAAQVWTNNAWIAAQSIGLGITGVFPVYVMIVNAVGVGQAGAIMAVYGDLGVFFGLILPHGLMELTAIFVAGGTGLKLFWTAVSPGPRSRGAALAEEGRALITVVIGLVVVLGVSGLVEGFVTGSWLPTWAQITIGAVVLAGYWAWTLIWGRRAVQAGVLGDLDRDVAGHRLAEVG